MAKLGWGVIHHSLTFGHFDSCCLNETTWTYHGNLPLKVVTWIYIYIYIYMYIYIFHMTFITDTIP